MKNYNKVLVLIGVILAVVKCDDADQGCIREPCKDSSDVNQCVRNFFEEHSSGSVVQDLNDEPVYLNEKHYAFAPRVGMTFVLVKTKVSNLNGQIEKFYINEKTGNLVMSVAFDGVFLNASRADLTIHRRSEEPIIISENIYGTYPVVLTAIIDASKEITASVLKSSMINGFLTQTQINFYLGPKFAMNSDPEVQDKVTGILADVPTVVKELLLTGAPDFFILYLQKYICDFGISHQELTKLEL